MRINFENRRVVLLSLRREVVTLIAPSFVRNQEEAKRELEARLEEFKRSKASDFLDWLKTTTGWDVVPKAEFGVALDL